MAGARITIEVEFDLRVAEEDAEAELEYYVHMLRDCIDADPEEVADFLSRGDADLTVTGELL